MDSDEVLHISFRAIRGESLQSDSNIRNSSAL
jgi:hypothetical protein